MKVWAVGARLAFAGGMVAVATVWVPPSALAAGPATAVFVTNSHDNTISVIDAATDSVVATIPVGQKPWAVAVSSDGVTAYVSNSGASSVSVVDMRTRKVRTTVAVGERPCDLLLSPDGRFLYVALYVESAVAIVDTHTDAVVGKLAVDGVNPYGMAMSRSGDTLYTANVDGTDNAASTVSVIDLRASKSTVAVGGFDGTEGVAVSPDGTKFYAASITTNVFSELDARTNTITRSVNVGSGPQGVAVSPDGSAIYAADSGAATVSVVDSATFRLTRTVQVGATPAELAFSADGTHLYVSNFDAGSMSDVDVSTGAVLATVAVGADPHGIAVGREVAAASGDGAVSSIANSLPTPSDAFSSATAVIASAAVAVGGTFFLTFPANLFNLTLHENYAALRLWWFGLPGRFRRKPKPAGTPRGATPFDGTPSGATPSGATPSGATPDVGAGVAAASRAVEPAPRPAEQAHEKAWFAAVVLAGALFGALLDPRFGANARSAESYIAVVVTVLVGAALPALVTSAYYRASAGSASYHLEALPGGLLIAAGCVLLSRLANFQPGYLYGVVAGVAFTRVLEKRQKGHVIALSTLTTLTVAIVAWFAWVPVDRIAQKPGAFAGLVIADDFLGSMFVGGLVGTVIGLLPLQFLPGWSLKEWHRGVWAALFALASFGVVDFLLIKHQAHHGNGSSIVVTVTLFVLFAAGSIAFREHFARKRRLAAGVTLHGFRQWFRDLVSPAPSAVAAAPPSAAVPAPREARESNDDGDLEDSPPTSAPAEGSASS